MLWAAVDVKDKNCIAEIVEEGVQMRYLSAAVMAEKWHVSERSVRNYCAKGRVTGAVLAGRIWNIPENAEKPERINKRKEQPLTLLDVLQAQKTGRCSGGIYHRTQIDLTYNSNHIEGNRLTHDQTRYIFLQDFCFSCRIYNIYGDYPNRRKTPSFSYGDTIQRR